jgi:hypothetical protein
MSDAATVERTIKLTADRVARLAHLAEARQVSEDLIVEKALDILFSLADLLDDPGERADWATLSEPSLHRVWNNDEDARYDHWRELYRVPPR